MKRTMMFFSVMLSAFFLTGSSLTSHDLCYGFIPENDQFYGVDDKTGSPVTEEVFNKILDDVESIYTPIVAKLGDKLEIERRWDDGTVNAYAQKRGKTRSVSMFGGLARHPLMTKDGFAMVVCHELGHHLGGKPTVGILSSWASVEGQSDYFATLKCARKYFEKSTQTDIYVDIDPYASELCEKSFKTQKDLLNCRRGSQAGHDLASVLNDLGSSSASHLAFDTPDRTIVKKTYKKHPKAQCRLDTYFAGALCPVPHTVDITPKQENSGQCASVTGHKIGLRPLCWYKP